MKLSVNDLRYRYPDGTTLGPLTLSATTGVVHLQGPNGSGKTTLLRVVGGVLEPSSGSVRLDGSDPFHHAPTRAHIGACAPAAELPGFLTATEAWRQWAAFRGAPSWNGAPLLAELDLPAHLRLDQMSSGQRRRAELIAALAGDPHLILLDETFTHLDDAGVHWLIDAIGRMRGQHLFVLSHHGELPLEADVTLTMPQAQRPA
ncbi:MAG: ATP-binding cassette domain-containing protein [Proteobacteria bacterium]|nr:ATP-binding cassette domain-containing protein [Pseudomonadota bacterium]